MLDTGNRIGRGACALFPGGVEVTEKPYEHEAAVARTLELMAGDTPAIFEAAFEAGASASVWIFWSALMKAGVFGR